MTPQQQIAHYRITAKLGEGGMGQVYRATDTRLGRDVALKILSPALAGDADYMARFQREAEVLASLNHRHIAMIHGLEESNGVRALVMELVEGPTLADLIAQGPIPVDEALPVALQIAEALEAAHEKGIIHRDLKPANVKVTPQGVVKVLDFGLAKAAEAGPTGAVTPNSPTLTMRATQAGVIMGTAGYMSPEQAAGKPVDKRSDIWSFGVVLWEMLTGERLFEGETISHVLADVLRAPIHLDKLPKGTPQGIRELLRRCLDRDLKKRLRDIGDAHLLLEQLPKPEGPQRSLVPWIVAGTACLAALIVAAIHFREAPVVDRSPAVFQFEPPSSVYTMIAVSPNGRYIAMTSRSSRTPLVVRPIDGLQIRQLPGTEGAQFPFWSPDSAYIGFSADGKLKRVAPTGGAPQTLCDGRGAASWGKDGYILFGSGLGGGIQRVPAAGGVPVPVMAAPTTRFIRIDQVLPGGRQFLYSIDGEKPEDRGIYVGSLDRSRAIRLVSDQSNAIFVPGTSPDEAYILFVRDTTLMAAPFDTRAWKITGEMQPVAEQVANVGFVYQYAFSASDNGVLAYRSATNGGLSRELAWIDRTGKPLRDASKPASIGAFELSPDGTRAAFQVLRGDQADLWLADMNRVSMSRFTFTEGVTYSMVWAPDGGRIAFTFYDAKKHTWALYVKTSTGTAEQQLLTGVEGTNATVYDWSRDGKFLVYGAFVNRTKADLWLLPMEGDRKPVPYLRTPVNEIDAQFSPDGRWMAYSSDESGRYQVYVQGIPAGAAKWQVSENGGIQPRWSRDGKELFYISADNMLTSVRVRGASPLETGNPTTLFRIEPLGPDRYAYEPSLDGKQFLVNIDAPGSIPPVNVVLDWRALLKR
jgi:serine/threonine protein kinase